MHGGEIKNRPHVSLIGSYQGLKPTPAMLGASSPLPPLSGASVMPIQIPAQWGPHNWEPCLLFSPLPPTSSPFHFPPIDILSPSLSEHVDWVSRGEPSPHQRLRLSGSICCSFPDSSPSIASVDPPSSPSIASVDPPCTAAIYPECTIAQAVVPRVY